MSGYQQRDLSGSLFRNDKATTDAHPTHTGSITVGGVTYRLAAWVKEGQKGKFFSLKLTPPDEGRVVTKESVAQKGASIDDEIPF